MMAANYRTLAAVRIDLVGTTADVRPPGPRRPLPLNHLPGENHRTEGMNLSFFEGQIPLRREGPRQIRVTAVVVIRPLQ